MNERIQQREFLAEFGKEHQDTVTKLIMVQLYGSETLLADMGLHYLPGMKELWGLFVLGEKLHFFAPASESSLSVLFRSASGGKPPASQYVCLSDFAAFNADLPQKQGFLSFLFAHPDIVLEVKVSPDSQTGTLYGQLNEKPAETAALLKKYAKSACDNPDHTEKTE